MKKLILFVIASLFAGWVLAAININTATKEELDALPGVGPVRAQAIVDYRKANGPFKSPEDIKQVKGIGDVTYEKMKSEITVGGRSSSATKTSDMKAAAPSTMKADKAPAAGTAKSDAKAPPAIVTAAPSPNPDAKSKSNAPGGLSSSVPKSESVKAEAKKTDAMAKDKMTAPAKTAEKDKSAMAAKSDDKAGKAAMSKSATDKNAPHKDEPAKK